MTVELYSKPNCVQCTQSKKLLDKLGVAYTTLDVMEDETAYNFVVNELGYKAAPVLVVRDSKGNVVNSWSGFQPDNLNTLTV